MYIGRDRNARAMMHVRDRRRRLYGVNAKGVNMSMSDPISIENVWPPRAAGASRYIFKVCAWHERSITRKCASLF